MTVDLVLVRHGNTFGPEDPVVWVGAREDLPLVESGRAQAERLRAALVRLDWSPTAAVSGGLARQTEHLAIAAPKGTPQHVDPDLAEFDFGRRHGVVGRHLRSREPRRQIPDVRRTAVGRAHRVIRRQTAAGRRR